MRSLSFTWVALGALCCLSAITSAAFIGDPFDVYADGGTGWSSNWGSNPAISSVAIADTSPINGGGSYLTYRTLVTGGNAVYRDFMGPISTGVHTVKLDVRVDTLNNFFGGTDLSDRIQIFGDAGSATGDLGSNTTWAIMASPNTALDNWYFYDGRQTGAWSSSYLLNTGIPVVDGGVYSITVTVYPATLTYDATIVYGTTTFTRAGLRFRAGPTIQPSDRICFANKIRPVGTTELQLSYDSVRIFAPSAYNPVPANDEIQVPLANPVLSWSTGMCQDPSNPNAYTPVTNPAITGHYVYFRENDPNLAVTPVLVTGNSYALPSDLQINATYYWRVDERLGAAGPNDPNIIKGSAWTFEAKTTDPLVWAGQNVVTYPVEGTATVAINADIEWYNPQSAIEWSVVSMPTEAPEGSVQFSSTSVEDPTVTITYVGRPYVLKLKGTDTNGAFAEDTMQIDVYADSCLAARNVQGYQAIPGDLNTDCRVNINDLAVLASNWARQNYLLQNGSY